MFLDIFCSLSVCQQKAVVIFIFTVYINRNLHTFATAAEGKKTIHIAQGVMTNQKEVKKKSDFTGVFFGRNGGKLRLKCTLALTELKTVRHAGSQIKVCFQFRTIGIMIEVPLVLRRKKKLINNKLLLACERLMTELFLHFCWGTFLTLEALLGHDDSAPPPL